MNSGEVLPDIAKVLFVNTLLANLASHKGANSFFLLVGEIGDEHAVEFFDVGCLNKETFYVNEVFVHFVEIAQHHLTPKKEVVKTGVVVENFAIYIKE